MRISLLKPLVILALAVGLTSTIAGTAAAVTPGPAARTTSARTAQVQPARISTARLRFGVTTPNGLGGAAELDALAKTVGESPSMVLDYSDFVQAAPIAGLDAMSKRGQSVVITWEPWKWGATDQSPYALRNIIAGRLDSYLNSWATALQKWGKPVTLRFAHEMNGDWYPWDEGVNGNTAGQYVQAWRHVHDLFVRARATNVSWMWSPNVPYQGSRALAGLYPGAAYVDTVALDGYNFGTSQSGTTWIEPDTLFAGGLSQLRALAPHKPIVIGETASAEAGGAKNNWISGLVPYLAAQSDVTGFFWFDQNKETDWRIDSSSASSAAFSAALAARRR